ncbi:3'-5' exonuclease [Gulosibacter molinativorax]|uniref:DNA 3'-5' helicase n=1 Tax=Gulosibacter molinativorax TaxID=256821 RepID=A0ABT7C4G6_9MICO|nr:3'-5' exonuclease [Gulosibacter molinativorax]MDJ1369930.1 ATP-dependent helicase [Gulosibacter molinativorax]QUY61900.1 Helicase IV [Gulosibacter molinativorax]
MPQVVWAQQKSNKIDGSVKPKVFNFVTKLYEDDTAPGLHIEPMVNAADPRARTGRVDDGLRAVLFRLDPPGGEVTYVFIGVWEHDEAIEIAKTRRLQVNPVNGVNEIIEVGAGEASQHVDDVVAKAQEIAAAQQKAAEATAAGLIVTPVLERKGYTLAGLVEDVGFSVADAERLMAARDEAELSELVDAFGNAWQELAVIAMLEGQPIEGILAEITEPIDDSDTVDEIDESDAVDEPAEPARASTPEPDHVQTEDERILRGFQHPAARRQFTYVEGQDELRRVIEAEDFGAWTVFLHPDQRHYVDRDYAGTFRLTGGAGTGKTVILLHRARRLALANPDARIVLTTFTRSLARMLSRDLQRLDPKLKLANRLGEAGIYIGGVDQLVAEVQRRWKRQFNAASVEVIGSSIAGRNPVTKQSTQWATVAQNMQAVLGPLADADFLDEEYLDIVLRERIISRDDYLRTSRLGSGVRLGRKQRVDVWNAIEQYRLSERVDREVTFPELAAIGAVAAAGVEGGLADHVLVDEGQDLVAPQWQFLRALARPGANDLFIAEDAHQRIYGRPVRMARVGIDLRGRSRRLKLNYRTTQETLDFALEALRGETWETGEGTLEDASGYVSARRGPAPRLVGTPAGGAQIDVVQAEVRHWIDDGVDPLTIAVLARKRNDAQSIATFLSDAGIPARLVQASSEGVKGSVVTMTMHQSKGHEFSRVLLYDMSRGRFPATLRGASEAVRDEHRRHEAALLYVSATRARDELVVTYEGEVTGLLGDA